MPQHAREVMSLQPFDSDAHRRWTGFCSDGQDRVEVSVEGNNDSIVCACLVENVAVTRLAHAKLANVYDIPTLVGHLIKNCSRGSGTPLVQNNAPQAASSGKTRSSRLHAAKASA